MWAYTWDGENRLTVRETLSTVTNAGRQKLEFAYDHQGRWCSKRVSSGWNGSAYTAFTTNYFYYDGWNVIGMWSASSSRTFLWGQDLSGSPQGAGGVGGLLAVTDSTQRTHFPAFDGNGNVAALANATDGSVPANYEYGPSGEPIRVTGAMGKVHPVRLRPLRHRDATCAHASVETRSQPIVGLLSHGVNPIRWSTKFTDDETGHVHYGFRSNKPSTGRWNSRDSLNQHVFAEFYSQGKSPAEQQRHRHERTPAP